jgi:hypothetical protein
MFRIVGLIMSAGSIFSMCQGGSVPTGCCDPGDRLDVVVVTPDRQAECDHMGGTLEGYVCVGVDF